MSCTKARALDDLVRSSNPMPIFAALSNRLFRGKKQNALMSTPTLRCAVCTKKVGLNGFECRCTQVFCAQHRLPFDHQCPVDVKTLQTQKLIVSCPKITTDKLIKL